jgi:hypothetical protein
MQSAYKVWVRITETQTINIVVQAGSDYEAKLIAEAQYGQGNVLSYFKVQE